MKTHTSTGDVSSYGLAIGYRQASHPQPHIKVWLSFNGCTYDVHVMDLEALVGTWGQYETVQQARGAFKRAVRHHETADVSAFGEPPWRHPVKAGV